MRDLVIIGAGPAGLAAARVAGECGLDAVLLDEQAAPGGQIWRAVGAVAEHRPADLTLFGKSYAAGIAALSDPVAVDRVFGSSVWQIDRKDGCWRVIYSRESAAAQVRTRAVLIATGAMERPVPIPGWTLPGVTTVGALQLALKQSGAFPAGRLVIAGSGPLPLLLADQFRRARIPIAAILDTQPRGALSAAVPHLSMAALSAPETLAEGITLLRARGRSGTRVIHGAEPLEILGAERVEGVRYRDSSGVHEVAADHVALHEGVVPNTQLTRLLGLPHRWNVRQRCFAPELLTDGRTALDGVFVAGDGGGVLGWRAARASGALAALSVACDLGHIPESAHALQSFPHQARLRGERRLRAFLDALYPVPDWLGRPSDETILCRCEEVSAGDVRAAVADGCMGPNQLKAFLRAGMGPCQGRMCALSVAEVMARARGLEAGDVGLARIRPPIKPVSLNELASLHEEATP
jgi:NADPH-dependent 2,4-dienoyl-CoA reductase/sulfur reductase-like enzyme